MVRRPLEALTVRRSDLAAGLGVVVFDGPQGPGFYKGGHDDTTGNTWVCVKAAKRCVVILANDVRAEAAFPRLVEFVLGDGRRQRSPVLDISAGGLSFALPDGAPAFEPGTRLDAVVHLGDRHIRGRLTVAHATAEFAAGIVCGARFDPGTEADAREFERVLQSVAQL